MLFEISIIISVSLILFYLFSKAGLPGLLGLIVAGVVMGQSCFNMVSPEVSALLVEFKTAALIVILIRAGLGINRSVLRKVGKPALRLSFIPGLFEGVAIMLISVFLLGFSLIEGGMLGFIIAAVSPAVVVPMMLDLKEGGYGKNREVPTMILAGASLDDVFAITMFGVFTGLAAGNAVNLWHIAITVPAGIIIGVLVGMLLGYGLVWFFKHYHVRDTKKVILFIIIAIVFNAITEFSSVKQVIPVAGLLGIMAMGYVILEKYEKLAHRLASKFNKVWVLAEILLFFYIGSEVKLFEINGALIGAGLMVLLFGLMARSIGVWFSLLGTHLTRGEKLFSVIAYLPKATVQAAIGAVPLNMVLNNQMPGVGVDTAQNILTVAVLSIVVTAPLGAILLKLFGKKLLADG